VRDVVLLLERQLGEAAPAALVGDEDRVVAEPALPRRTLGDAAAHETVGDQLSPVRPAHDGHRAENGRPLGHAVEGLEQLGDVRGVGGLGPRVAGRVDTGRAV